MGAVSYALPIALLLVVSGHLVACQVEEVEVKVDDSTNPDAEKYKEIREEHKDVYVRQNHRDNRIRTVRRARAHARSPARPLAKSPPPVPGRSETGGHCAREAGDRRRRRGCGRAALR